MLPFSSDHDLFDHSSSFSCDEQTLVLHPKQPNPLSSPDVLLFSPFAGDPLLFHTMNMSDITADPPGDLPSSAKKELRAQLEEAKSSDKRSSRKRAVRKDRHRKIDTAQGPRDRRMRLSLDVARKFFDLQELLGFDKPSKTVQWLLNKSRSAIKEITAAKSSPSECEEISMISYCKAKSSSAAKAMMRNIVATQPCRKNEVIRATRAKARERARERTMTKKLMSMIPSSLPIQFETIESTISHDLKSSSIELVADVDHQVDCQMNFLGSNEAISIILEQWDGCYQGNIYPRLRDVYANR